MKLFFIVAAFLGILAVSNAATPGFGGKIECLRGLRIYESRIRKLVQELQDKLKKGDPENDIPPLDPFVMDNWNLKVKEDFAKLNWNMTGPIKGLMSFELVDVEFTLDGYEFSFSILFPSIIGKGNYSILGSILEVLPVYGSGNFDVIATELKVSGHGNLHSEKTGENETVTLTNFSVETSLESFIFGVEGLMDDDNLSYMISKMISESLPYLIQNFQTEINDVVSEKVTAVADKAFEGKTIQEIIEFLGKPEEYMSAFIDCGGF